MSLDGKDPDRRFLAGDSTMLKELETDVWPCVAWRIQLEFPWLFGREDMRDLLQESLWEFWESLPRYDGSKGSAASWFAGIARYKAKELAKSGWMRQRQWERSCVVADDFNLLANSFAERRPEPEADSDSAESDSADTGRDESDEILLLRECLEKMPPRRRDILFACRACDGDPPTSRQLADEFGVTPEVIRQELHRAEAEIRKRFEDAKLVPPPPDCGCRGLIP